jgi:hypothetical protein
MRIFISQAIVAGTIALGVATVPAAAADVQVPEYQQAPPVGEYYGNPPPVEYGYRRTAPPVNNGYPYGGPPAAYYAPGPVYPGPVYAAPVYPAPVYGAPYFYGPRVYRPYGARWSYYRRHW